MSSVQDSKNNVTSLEHAINHPMGTNVHIFNPAAVPFVPAHDPLSVHNNEPAAIAYYYAPILNANNESTEKENLFKKTKTSSKKKQQYTPIIPIPLDLYLLFGCFIKDEKKRNCWQWSILTVFGIFVLFAGVTYCLVAKKDAGKSSKETKLQPMSSNNTSTTQKITASQNRKKNGQFQYNITNAYGATNSSSPWVNERGCCAGCCGPCTLVATLYYFACNGLGGAAFACVITKGDICGGKMYSKNPCSAEDEGVTVDTCMFPGIFAGSFACGTAFLSAAIVKTCALPCSKKCCGREKFADSGFAGSSIGEYENGGGNTTDNNRYYSLSGGGSYYYNDSSTSSATRNRGFLSNNYHNSYYDSTNITTQQEQLNQHYVRNSDGSYTYSQNACCMDCGIGGRIAAVVAPLVIFCGVVVPVALCKCGGCGELK